MLVGANVDTSWLVVAAFILNCKMGHIPFLYLRLPIGGDSLELNFWKPLFNRIKSRLSSWKCRNLSLDGRLVLLKYVLSYLPVYFLSFFKAPSCIIFSIKTTF